MVAVRRQDVESTETAPAELSKVERDFFAAVDNPKPAPEYLKEMFRLYGSRSTEE